MLSWLYYIYGIQINMIKHHNKQIPIINGMINYIIRGIINYSRLTVIWQMSSYFADCY